MIVQSTRRGINSAMASSAKVIRLATAVSHKVHQPTPRRCGIAVAEGAATPIGVKWQPPSRIMPATDRERVERVLRVLEELAPSRPSAA